MLQDFHPAVRTWFERSFDRPTPPQTRGWRAIRSGAHTLIAAPTGSGKTLAAFLNAVDALFREGLESGLKPETRVLYVSPLKALSTDIHRNLSEPREQISEMAEEMGYGPVNVTAAVRTGDTPQSERRAMVDTPPHILVTTPESLYLLLTAEKSREFLETVETVIVDEIHAVIESRRGSHLALSLERLKHVTKKPLQRIGLSATQKPIDKVARFLVGERVDGADSKPECTIIDEGHFQELDLDLVLPDSPLEAVMSHEVWEELYEKIVRLLNDHETTLIFVNTRREAERIAKALSDRMGPEEVAAHHGSLSKETRLRAERKLKDGTLTGLVATASMELGIDIGHVDLVCQLGSPKRMATFLQRVGRSGHTVAGTPKGRFFPLSRDDLVEGVALLRAVRRGALDRVEILEEPIDILCQQIIAEAACEDWDEDALYGLYSAAYPYRNLSRETFDRVVRMAAEGFTRRGGRKGARIHYDAVNGQIRSRKGTRLAALTCGGAIPDNGDYRVLKEPNGTYIGSVNEEFAIESMPGDIMQLGNTSWRILKVETGVVRVEDAGGQPPTLPFWVGQAPARSPELSAAISELRTDVEAYLAEHGNGEAGKAVASQWMQDELGISESAASQIAHYLGESRHILGTLPSLDTLVLERFFDESGGMQLVLHAPFGHRVNRAWGLALRKRFCRKFNFELQATATEDAILLSLGPQHSFPLEEVFEYLHPNTVRDVLVQALLDSPPFLTRWRWTVTLALALLRWKGGSKVPPQLQRMESEDMLSAVFPDATACLEHVAGEREIPDHPLVNQTIEDCLTEMMNLPRLKEILEQVHEGAFELVARDTPEPSPLAHEIITARPYAYLDDGELEERRTRAVHTRRAMDPSDARELGTLDPEAIERVQEEVWPGVETADELHDLLMSSGAVRPGEAEGTETGPSTQDLFQELVADGRAVRVRIPYDNATTLWLPAERIPQAKKIWPKATVRPEAEVPDKHGVIPDDRLDAIVELVRCRMGFAGPVTARALAQSLAIPLGDVRQALRTLEQEGDMLRGQFSPTVAPKSDPRELTNGLPGDTLVSGDGLPASSAQVAVNNQGEGKEAVEWCERSLLFRIHRYTLDRLRSQTQPVSPADFMRFLLRWQRVHPDHQVSGTEGLATVVDMLQGVDAPAASWETDILAARCSEYDAEMLDQLCTAGRVMWGRLVPPDSNGERFKSSGPLRTSPMGLWLRDDMEVLLSLAPTGKEAELTGGAETVWKVLEERGATFFPELVREAGMLPTQVEQALGELVSVGRVTADSFSGLRALLTPSDRRRPIGGRKKNGRRKNTAPYGVDTAGRWSKLEREVETPPTEDQLSDDPEVEVFARILLYRYGVVFRRLLDREPVAPSWRKLLWVYRRLEARGEIRGGRFVEGFSGQQFALPEAVGKLRSVRNEESDGELRVISATDPLNLTGVITPGERISAIASNRIGYRGGQPVVVWDGDEVRWLEASDGEPLHAVKKKLVRRKIPPELRYYARV